MGPDRDGAHDGSHELKYPSPTAETADPGPFYHANTQDREHDHHETLEDQHGNKGSLIGHHEADLHQPDDNPEQQQHVARPPNLEELQLAAQLGHGLAGTSMMPTTDPGMGVEDSSLRNMLPPPDQEHQQTDPYIQDATAADHMVQHGLQVNVPGTLQSHFAMADNIPPRKRSKVSRACDECRRKKIKCDAQSDTGEAPCSSCARSSIRCLFSRVPQKRGPSKGYIKELADRIHSIEHKLETEGALTHEDLSGLFAPERPRQGQPNEDPNRKRPFSSISGDNFEVSGRPPSWSAEPRQSQVAEQSTDHTPLPSSASDAAAADTTQQVAQMDTHFSLLPHTQLEQPDRDWCESMDAFRNSYLSELPILKDENAHLKMQLETAVSRIDELEDKLKQVLETFNNSKSSSLESRAEAVDLAERFNDEPLV